MDSDVPMVPARNQCNGVEPINKPLLPLEGKIAKNCVFKTRSVDDFFELSRPQKKILKAEIWSFLNLIPGSKYIKYIVLPQAHQISTQNFREFLAANVADHTYYRCTLM